MHLYIEVLIYSLADALVAANRKCHESLALSPTQTKLAGLHGKPTAYYMVMHTKTLIVP